VIWLLFAVEQLMVLFGAPFSIGEHLEHTVSAVDEHARAWYLPV